MLCDIFSPYCYMFTCALRSSGNDREKLYLKSCASNTKPRVITVSDPAPESSLYACRCALTFAPKTSDKVYCDSYKCPHGYYLIDDADDVECKWGRCRKYKCCERYCSSYKCPKHYTWKSGYEKIKCKDSWCTTDKCCEFHCESAIPVTNSMLVR